MLNWLKFWVPPAVFVLNGLASGVLFLAGVRALVEDRGKFGGLLLLASVFFVVQMLAAWWGMTEDHRRLG